MITRRFADLLARLRGSGRETDHARLAAILELNRRLALVEDRRVLLECLLDEAVAVFGAERGFVITDSGDELRVEVARNLDREPVRHASRKISTTIVRRCLDERAGVFCEDAQEGDFGAAQSVADLALRSVLCMPLLAGDALLGCLYLDHRFRSDAFGPDDLPWLQAFADQAAIILHLHQAIDRNRAHARAAQARSDELASTVVAQAQELRGAHGARSRGDLRYDYAEILGASPAILRCLALVDRVTPVDVPVLLLGESGTGKELVARALHRNGSRSHRPFSAINLAAVAPALLESELFGHVKGAFTGADRNRPGLLRDAHGGVLFLDEITEFDPAMQAKLLRFLEDSMVRPVGGARAEPVDVRIIAATNRIPAEAIAQGLLREDLYYRLAVVSVDLPPLRDRSTDLPVLIEHFLAEAATARNGAPRTLTPACQRALQQRSWPGNIRELRNEMLRADALADGDVIGPETLSPPRASPTSPSLNLAELERWAIERALTETGGNKAEAARRLGISRRTLYNRLGEERDR